MDLTLDFPWHSAPSKGKMFSKENRRFTGLLIGVVILATVTLSNITKMVDGGFSQYTVLITGFSSVVLLQLFGMMRTEQARVAQQRAGGEIKAKVEELGEKKTGDITKAIHTAAVEVKKAVQEPAPGQEAMPRTREELQSLLKIFARTMTEDLVNKAAVEAAEKAAKLASESTVRETVRIVTEELRKSGHLK